MLDILKNKGKSPFFFPSIGKRSIFKNEERHSQHVRNYWECHHTYKFLVERKHCTFVPPRLD